MAEHPEEERTPGIGVQAISSVVTFGKVAIGNLEHLAIQPGGVYFNRVSTMCCSGSGCGTGSGTGSGSGSGSGGMY